MTKKIKKNLAIRESLAEELARKSKEWDIKESLIIEAAIDEYLRKIEAAGKITIEFTKPEVSPKGKSKSETALAA